MSAKWRFIAVDLLNGLFAVFFFIYSTNDNEKHENSCDFLSKIMHEDFSCDKKLSISTFFHWIIYCCWALDDVLTRYCKRTLRSYFWQRMIKNLAKNIDILGKTDFLLVFLSPIIISTQHLKKKTSFFIIKYFYDNVCLLLKLIIQI